jgi:hypothetical protein
MSRILLIVLGAVLVLCVLCVGIGYFVALPRTQDALEEDMEEAIATYVVPNIAGPGVTPEAGTYTLSDEDVNREIQSGDTNLDDLVVEITPGVIEIRFGQQSQELTYQAGATVEDGRLVLIDDTLSGVPDWLLSAENFSNAIENGINDYLVRSGLVLTSVELGDGEMTFVTAAEGQ